MKKFTLARNPIVVNIPAHAVDTISDRETIQYNLEVYTIKNNVGFLETTLQAYEEPVVTEGGSVLYNGANFDISEILFSKLENRIGADLKSTIPFVPINKSISYYTKKSVTIAGVTTQIGTTASETAIFAGLSTEHYESNKETIFAEILTKKGFLTYKSANRQIIANGIDYLSWLYNSSEVYTELSLVATGTYTDNSTVSKVIYTFKPSSEKIHHLPLSAKIIFNSLGQTNKLDPKNLKHYTVELKSGSTAITSKIKYTLDRQEIPNIVSLIFENSLGGLDIVDCFGENQSTIENQNSTGKAFRGFGFQAITAEEIVSKVQSQEKFELNTRLIDTKKITYLADIIHTYNMFLYVCDASCNVSIVPVTHPKSIISKTIETEVGFKFEVNKAYLDNAYSDLNQKEIIDNETYIWKPISGSCELDASGKFTGIYEVNLLQKFKTDNTPTNPIITKQNTIGTEGYVAPFEAISCSLNSTPFKNFAYSIKGTFKNQTCTNGLVGDFATITIDADTFGSTINQADADSKAELYAKSLDTQLYANLNGPCNTPGFVIPVVIPPGRFWFKLEGIEIQDIFSSGISAQRNISGYIPGNMFFNLLGQINQTDVFTNDINRNDRHYPVLNNNTYSIHYYNNNLNGVKTLSFYRNGLLVGNQLPIFRSFHEVTFPVSPQDQDYWNIIVQ